MPPLIRYRVEQTRDVIVTATTPIDAVNLANRVFDGEKTPEDQINIARPVREIEYNVREDR